MTRSGLNLSAFVTTKITGVLTCEIISFMAASSLFNLPVPASTSLHIKSASSKKSDTDALKNFPNLSLSAVIL